MLCFVAGMAMAQEYVLPEATRLVAFRRSIYKDGWELKYEKWQTQKAYMNDWKLDKYEMRSIMMASSPELSLYERGRKKKNLGNTFLNIGIPATVSVFGSPLGGAFVIMGVKWRAESEGYIANAVDLHNSRIKSPPAFGDELTLYRHRLKAIKYKNIAIISFCAGAAALSSGIYYLVKGSQTDRNLIGMPLTLCSSGLMVNGIMFMSVSKTYKKKAFQ